MQGVLVKTATKIVVGVAAVGIGALAFGIWRRRAIGLGLADGPTKDRIGDLQDVVWDAVRDGQMRELALAVTGRGTRQVTIGNRTIAVRGANCPPRDGRCEANAVGRWVAENPTIANHAFSRVPHGPDRPAALSCSLLSLNGITCRLRSAKQTDGVARIYSVAGLPKLRPSRWSAIDSGLGANDAGYSFGKELPKADFQDFDG
jgi:hypothetical protein